MDTIFSHHLASITAYLKIIYSIAMNRHQQLNWAMYASQDEELGNPGFRDEALQAARTIFHPVRENLERIVDNLSAAGYLFEYPDRVLGTPIGDASHWVRKFQHEGLHLPVTFQAWIEEVGTINLVGRDPTWPELSTVELSDSKHLLVDPLEVEYDLEYFASELEQWQHERLEASDGYRTPFVISFSADDLHKANISGGLPYGLSAKYASVDPVVLYERHSLRFLTYITLSLTQGGFIGFMGCESSKNAFVQRILKGTADLCAGYVFRRRLTLEMSGRTNGRSFCASKRCELMGCPLDRIVRRRFRH